MKSPKPLVEIVSTGRFLPDRVVTNSEFESTIDTTDQWIVERTGIKERRHLGDQTDVAGMGISSAGIAMERAGVEAGEIDIIIVSTATPDYLLPSTACYIQAALGASNAMTFDISAACSGWLHGLTMAEGYLSVGHGETALVIATEQLTAITNWEDRSTCVLFGDGSGSAVLKKSDGSRGILGTHHGSDGNLSGLLHRKSGGAAVPIDEKNVGNKDDKIKMSGREVFKNAVQRMSESATLALDRSGLNAEDIDLLIPHQANFRIIESTARYSGIPMEKVFVNVDRYGNMSSASIPVAMDEALEQGRLSPGMNILAVAFGAGLNWSAVAIRW